MPKGPNGQKRPADVIGAAVMVGKIATGEAEETVSPKYQEAASLGSKGGKRRAEALSEVRRSEISKEAAKARWADRAAPVAEEDS